jgi:hypothetical protein
MKETRLSLADLAVNGTESITRAIGKSKEMISRPRGASPGAVDRRPVEHGDEEYSSSMGSFPFR